VTRSHSLRLVVQVEDVQRRRRGRFVFDRSPVHLGRSELNDLVLAVPSVSLWHGVIRFDEASIHYVDTGSRNGTEVDGVAVKANQSNLVMPQQTLVIWPLHFKLVVWDGIEVGELNNSAQLQELFGGAQVEAPAKPGETRFVRALQDQLDPNPAEVTTILGSSEDQLRRAGVGAGAKGVAGDSTVIVSASLGVPGATSDGSRDAAAFADLDEAHGQLQSAIVSVQRQVSKLLVGRSEPERQILLKEVAAKYPRLKDLNLLGPHRPKVASGEVPSQPRASPPAARDADFGNRLLNQFAGSYVARRPRMDTEGRMERFLDRVAQVLEAFAKGFIELQRGHESFADQMGVGGFIRRTSGANAIDSIPQLLEFLLDESQSDGRIADLTRGFADVMVHQVALVGGIREGVREVLNQLSPEAVEQIARRRGGGILDAVVPAQKRWGIFAEQHRELMIDEERLTQVLFGKAFVRAYTLVASGGGAGAEQAPRE